MSELKLGTRVQLSPVPAIPKAWRGLTGTIVKVIPGRPTRYDVKLDGREAPLNGFSEDELDVVAG